MMTATRIGFSQFIEFAEARQPRNSNPPARVRRIPVPGFPCSRRLQDWQTHRPGAHLIATEVQSRWRSPAVRSRPFGV